MIKVETDKEKKMNNTNSRIKLDNKNLHNNNNKSVSLDNTSEMIIDGDNDRQRKKKCC